MSMHTAHGLPSHATVFYPDIKTVRVDGDGTLRLYRGGRFRRKREIAFHSAGRWDGVCLSAEHEAAVSLPLVKLHAA